MANRLFAGVDEVGRGCLAGPVVSCVVILKKNIKSSCFHDLFYSFIEIDSFVAHTKKEWRFQYF